MTFEILGQTLLHARVFEKAIQFYYQGKWRGVRYYGGKKIPSERIIKEAVQTFILNTGQKVTVEAVLPTIKWE